MPSLPDLKAAFPDVWEDAKSDNLRFAILLRDNDLIATDEYLPLLREIAQLEGIFIAEDTEEETLKQRMGVALWTRIMVFFSMMWSDIWKFWPEQFGKIYTIVIEKWFETADKLNKWQWDIFKLTEAEMKDYPPFILERMRAYNDKPSLLALASVIVYRISYSVGYSLSVLPIIGRDAVRELNKKYSPMLPDISTLVTYYYKKPTDRGLVYLKAAEQGFEKSEVDVYIKAMETLLSVEDLRSLYLRGIINDRVLSDHLHRSGWNDENIDKLKKVFFVIPGPSDQIRFAVREAFDDDYIKRFDTLKDFPEGFANEAKKVGVNRFWAEKFWIAHWELPPLAAAYEMLHRDVIKSSDLAELFKAQDIMPWWRDKLEAISYNPLTRVDVRRMYKTGTLDRAGVHRAYLDVGYNEKNAALMTDFTIKWVQGAERDLTKSDILGAYQRRLLDKKAVNKALIELGYDKREAELLMSRTDYDLAKKKKVSVLKNLEKSYKRGTMDSGRVQGRMQELNMSGAEITELVNLWDAETRDDTASLSRGDIDAMVKRKILSKDEYRAELSKLKYVSKDIDLLVKLNG